MKNNLLLIIFLSFVPITASLCANTADSEVSNHSGFPTTLREAGECFFGNYKSLVATLQDNILVNHYRIKIIKQNNSLNEQKPTLANHVSARNANVLTNTNVALASQLTSLKGKCSSFPNWD